MQFIPRLEIDSDERLHPQFRQCYQLSREFDWQAALAANAILFEEPQLKLDPFFPLYLSYYGLLKMVCGEKEGIQYCRDAAKKEFLQSEIFANLSLAELQVRNRARALVALQYGLQLNPKSSTLRLIAYHMGKRRRPKVSFLHRNHPINRFLGKVTYRKSQSRLRSKVG